MILNRRAFVRAAALFFTAAVAPLAAMGENTQRSNKRLDHTESDILYSDNVEGWGSVIKPNRPYKSLFDIGDIFESRRPGTGWKRWKVLKIYTNAYGVDIMMLDEAPQ